MDAQLIFLSYRRYRLSVAVWWYFLVRLWVKLFVSQGLIKLSLAYLMGINDLLLLLKTSAWSKGNKDGSPSPHNCCLIILLRCSGRKFLVWLCEETSNNKHGWTPLKYLNALHHHKKKKFCNTLCKSITNFIFWVLWTYLVTSIKNNNPNL